MKQQELFDLINELVFWDAERFKEDFAEKKAMEYINEFKASVCKQQREICEQEARDYLEMHGIHINVETQEAILNAPEPS